MSGRLLAAGAGAGLRRRLRAAVVRPGIRPAGPAGPAGLRPAGLRPAGLRPGSPGRGIVPAAEPRQLPAAEPRGLPAAERGRLPATEHRYLPAVLPPRLSGCRASWLG